MQLSLEAGNIDNTSVTVGTQEIVLRAFFHHSFGGGPDAAAPSLWSPDRSSVRVWLPHSHTYCLEGPNLKSLQFKEVALRPSPVPGEFDDNYSGICGSIVRFPDGKYYGAYHGDNGGTRTTGGVSTNLSGFWQEVGAAVSEDGVSFKRIGKIITAWEPMGTILYSGADQNFANGGAQHPSVVFSRDGKYVYCYYIDYLFSISGITGNFALPMSVARSKVSDKMAPGSWMKYYHPYTTDWQTNHSSFCGWIEPGLKSQPADLNWFLANYTTSVNYPTTLLTNAGPGWIMHSVRYITNSRVYLATLIDLTNTTTGKSSGLYYALSTNGIEWSSAVLITNHTFAPQPGFNLQYPSFIEGAGCNSTTIHGWIFYNHQDYASGTSTAALFPLTITAPGPLEHTPLVNPPIIHYSVAAGSIISGSNVDAGKIRAFDPDAGFEDGYGIESVKIKIRSLGSGNLIYEKTFTQAPFAPGNILTSGWPTGSYELTLEARSVAAVGGEWSSLVQTNHFVNTGTLPETASGLSVAAVSATQLKLSWWSPAPESHTLLYRSTDKDLSKASLIALLPPDQSDFDNRGLASETVYYFFAKVSNGYGVSAPSLAASGKTLPAGSVEIPQDGGKIIFENAFNTGWTSNSVVPDAREIWLSTTNTASRPGRSSFSVKLKVTTSATTFPGVSASFPQTIDGTVYNWFSLETFIKDWPTSFFSNGITSRLYQGSYLSRMDDFNSARFDKEFAESGTWMQYLHPLTNFSKNALDRVNFFYQASGGYNLGTTYQALFGNMRIYRTNLLVQNVTARKISGGTRVSWSNSGASSYALEYSPDKMNFLPLATGIVGTNYFQDAVDPRKNYFYRVAPEVGGEAQMYSAPEASSTVSPARPILTARFVSSSQIDLQWDNASGGSDYTVYQGTSSDINSAKVLAVYGTNVFSHSATQLSPSSSYTFWVARRYGDSYSASAGISVRTPGPSELNFKNRIAGLTGDLEIEVAPHILTEGKLVVQLFQVSGAALPVKLQVVDGKIRWSGVLENGRRAQVGNYIVALQSEKKYYRAAFVLAW